MPFASRFLCHFSPGANCTVSDTVSASEGHLCSYGRRVRVTGKAKSRIRSATWRRPKARGEPQRIGGLAVPCEGFSLPHNIEEMGGSL